VPGLSIWMASGLLALTLACLSSPTISPRLMLSCESTGCGAGSRLGEEGSGSGSGWLTTWWLEHGGMGVVGQERTWMRVVWSFIPLYSHLDITGFLKHGPNALTYDYRTPPILLEMHLVRKKDVVACGGELDKSNILEKLQWRWNVSTGI